ncbi:DUF4192 family protein [Nocardia niigatensis]
MTTRSVVFLPTEVAPGVWHGVRIGYHYADNHADDTFFAARANVLNQLPDFDTLAAGEQITDPQVVVDQIAEYVPLGEFPLAAMITDWPRLRPLRDVQTHIADLHVAARCANPASFRTGGLIDWQSRGRIQYQLPRIQRKYNEKLWNAAREGAIDPEFLHRSATTLHGLITRLAAGEPLQPREYAKCANLIAQPEIFAVFLADPSPEVAQFFEHGAVTFPDPYRAQALVGVGYGAHRRGDHEHGHAAVTDAVRLDPNHEVAQLLSMVFQHRDGTSFDKLLDSLAFAGRSLAEAIEFTSPAADPDLGTAAAVASLPLGRPHATDHLELAEPAEVLPAPNVAAGLGSGS